MAHYKGAASEGGRAATLIKKRQKEQEEVEAKKKKIEEELKLGSITNKFAAHYDAIEQTLKSSTIGNILLCQLIVTLSFRKLFGEAFCHCSRLTEKVLDL